MNTTTELEALVILKYGRPEFTFDYIYSLPAEVAERLILLLDIRPDSGSIYGRLWFNLPVDLRPKACYHMLQLLVEYESRA